MKKESTDMKKQILIVDDELSILSVYKKLLSASTLEIYTADTIEQAIAMLKKQSFDAIITDLHLTNGLQKEGLKLIKAAKVQNENAVCILITAYGNPEVKDIAYSLGASYCFEKPVSTIVLKEALARHGIKT